MDLFGQRYRGYTMDWTVQEQYQTFIFKILEIPKIVDGDTVDLVLDLGFNIHIKRRFRLKGYDAPETWRPKNKKEKEAGERVKQFLTEILEKQDIDYLRVCVDKKQGKYSRYIGTIYDTFWSKSVNESVKEFIEENHLTKKELRND
tara:strand:+ start:1661 stop:2098 length:438 start_codon:yes stop_codon:yes gene_type:complete